MATKLSGGKASNTGDSNPQYLGTKLYDGQTAKAGSIVVRQRGTKILPGKNTMMGKDHTIFATTAGTVKFGTKRKTHFNGDDKRKKTVSIIPTA
jgi:large subunit ribosomal protein L27